MKKYILSLLCILMSFTLFAGTNVKTTNSDNVAKIKVASFNIQFAPTPEKVYWQTRKGAAKQLIAYHQFEIFGCQETYLHQIKDVMPVGYSFIGVARDDGAEKGEYCPILFDTSKFEVLKSDTFWISETPEKVSKGWKAKCHRICTWGEFKHKQSGKTFFFFNTHLDHKSTKAKEEGIKLLHKKISEIAGDKTFFLTGDFNVWAEHKYFKVMFDDVKFKHSRDVSETKPYGPSGSYHAYKGIATARLADLVIVSANVKVKRFAVLNDRIGKVEYDHTLKPKTQKDVDYASDHFPVTADVEF